MRTISIFGVFMPTLVPIFGMSVLLLWMWEKVFRRFGIYAKVAHPPFFRVCVFVIVFCCCGMLIYA